MRNFEIETATIGASDVATLTNSADVWDAVAIVVDEGSAEAGTLSVTLRYGGLSGYIAPATNTYTVGSSTGFTFSGAIITGVRITADGDIDADVAVAVHFMRRG